MENKSGSMNEKIFSKEHDTERTINKKKITKQRMKF